jgi:hypothetical protein
VKRRLFWLYRRDRPLWRDRWRDDDPKQKADDEKGAQRDATAEKFHPVILLRARRN